jgi:hypothetical protein
LTENRFLNLIVSIIFWYNEKVFTLFSRLSGTPLGAFPFTEVTRGHDEGV